MYVLRAMIQYCSRYNFPMVNTLEYFGIILEFYGIFQNTPGYYGIFQIIVIPLYSRVFQNNSRMLQLMILWSIQENIKKSSLKNIWEYLENILEYSRIFWNPSGIIGKLFPSGNGI